MYEEGEGEGETEFLSLSMYVFISKTYVQYGNLPIRVHPLPTPCCGRLQSGRGGMGEWGGVGLGVIPCGYISRLDMFYWIIIHTNIHTVLKKK